MKIQLFKLVSLVYLVTSLDINNFTLAQNKQLNCQATVYKILQKIRDKGVEKVDFIVIEKVANEGRIGNPTNRKDVLQIIMTSTGKKMIDPQITNIMISPKLLNSWANKIVKNCANTAFIAFGVNHTDGVAGYYIQADGTTKRETCISHNDNVPTPLPWGMSVCL